MAGEDAEVAEIKKQLSDDPSDEFLEKVATAVKSELEESIPELTFNSRPLEDVLDDFRTKKFDQVTSERQYERKLNYIETYLTNVQNIESTDQLTSEIVESYSQWRKYDSLDREKPLEPTTLQDDMYLFREFIQHLISHNLAPVRFEYVIDIPTVDSGKNIGVDTKQLEPKRARDILAYLRKFKWADIEHVTVELMCEAGPRKSGLYALDVEDFDGDNAVLHFNHREKTPLKNDEKSERSITLYGDVSNIIQDYLEMVRDETRDEFGRNPLLSTGDGRIGKSTIKKISYMWTRPCQIGKECPHDREPKSCEAANQNAKAYECPSSRAPHHVRTGYITAKRNEGVPIEAISQRCDVSPRVLKKHYDLPDMQAERKRHDDDFRQAESDEDSGFSH